MTAIETLGSLIESSDEEVEETQMGPSQTTARAKNLTPLTRMQVILTPLSILYPPN